MLLFSPSIWADSNRHHIEGLWRAESFRVAIEIEEDRNGIKVRRTDENRWYYYDFSGNGTYENRLGDRYRLWNEDQLEYSNDEKGQRIQFYRANTQNFRNNRDGRSGDNSPGYRKSIDYRTAANLLEGRWWNNSIRQRIFIDRRGSELVVHFDGRARTFRPSYDGYFEDRRGNRLKLMENQGAILDLVGDRRPLYLERDGRGHRSRASQDW